MTTGVHAARRAHPVRLTALCAAGATVLGFALPVAAFAGPPAVGTVTNLANTGTGTYAVAVADLDGNGVPDVVSAELTDGVSVSLNLGGHSFAATANYPTPSPSGAPQITAVTVADITGDHLPDVLAANAGDNEVVLWPGSGGGTLGTPRELQLNPQPGCGLTNSNPCLASYPAQLAVADLNGDGIADIVTANTNTDNLSVLLGTGGGSFAPAVQLPLGAGSAPATVAAADVNGDGHPDLVVGGGTGTITVLPGTGAGGFGTPSSFASGLVQVVALALADVNGDGIADAIATDGGFSGQAAVLLGNGGGGFGTASLYPAGTNPSAVAVSDINGDGKADLVLASTGSDQALVLDGDGTGGFGSGYPFGLDGGLGPQAVAVGDLDGDGRPDIVTGNLSSPGKDVSILWNASNRAPVAVNDSYSHPGSDTALTVPAPGVLANDTDADGNSLTASLVSGPAHGTVTLNPNGSFSYQAAEGYLGSDSFTYHDSDGTDTSNTATVTITSVAGCDGRAATITGSGLVNGTRGNDVIATGNGNDIVNAGQGGNDIICSYGGNDIVYLGSGNNYVNAGSGNDIVVGGSGNDTIYGGPGNDVLTGGGGVNTLVGGAGSDLLNGSGHDYCAGDDNGGTHESGVDIATGCAHVVEVP